MSNVGGQKNYAPLATGRVLISTVARDTVRMYPTRETCKENDSNIANKYDIMFLVYCCKWEVKPRTGHNSEKFYVFKNVTVFYFCRGA